MSQALTWKLYKLNHYHIYLDNTKAPVSQPQRNALKILNCFCMLYIQKVIPPPKQRLRGAATVPLASENHQLQGKCHRR